MSDGFSRRLAPLQEAAFVRTRKRRDDQRLGCPGVHHKGPLDRGQRRLVQTQTGWFDLNGGGRAGCRGQGSRDSHRNRIRFWGAGHLCSPALFDPPKADRIGATRRQSDLFRVSVHRCEQRTPNPQPSPLGRTNSTDAQGRSDKLRYPSSRERWRPSCGSMPIMSFCVYPSGRLTKSIARLAAT